jgi:hypothetical protein
LVAVWASHRLTVRCGKGQTGTSATSDKALHASLAFRIKISSVEAFHGAAAQVLGTLRLRGVFPRLFVKLNLDQKFWLVVGSVTALLVLIIFIWEHSPGFSFLQ